MAKIEEEDKFFVSFLMMICIEIMVILPKIQNGFIFIRKIKKLED